MTMTTMEIWACEEHPNSEWPHNTPGPDGKYIRCSGPGMPMKVETHNEIWDEIFSALDFNDLDKLRIHRAAGPAEWIKLLCEAVAEHLDGCDPCELDHCPDNCTSNCQLKPTGDPDATS